MSKHIRPRLKFLWRETPDEIGMRGLGFTGVRLTLFHWSHNERVYLGFLGGRFRFLCIPYPFMESFWARREPEPVRRADG